ncbi:MAG: DUF4097 family beta strand repeat protein [Acidobacteria bacterium]|nr:DUF4097 family beta strand repeat protein [Acidobacteriota bacterium]MBS1867488.1 DUF4097 family beta strand repeat protein [Acidobacteriota bacterium]
MKIPIMRVIRVAVPFSTAVLLACAISAPKAGAEEWTKSYSVSGRANVHLDTNDGSVRVMTSDTKQVELRVIYNGYTLDKNLKIESRQDGDRVELSARETSHWGWGIHVNRGLRLEVNMPKNADLTVESGDGSVETQAVMGSLDIHTGDGHIKVEGAKGQIKLRTGDGSIEGRDLDGQIDADSGDGHITLDGRFDSLNIRTGDGSITAHAQPGSKVVESWSIHTGDGSVDLALPGDLNANIDAQTNDGRISLGIPVMVEGMFSNSQIRGKMNSGGQSVKIHTGDGSIRLSKS